MHAAIHAKRQLSSSDEMPGCLAQRATQLLIVQMNLRLGNRECQGSYMFQWNQLHPNVLP